MIEMWITCRTVKELDDVSEVHVVVYDDLTVQRNQRQGQEEDEVARRDPGSHPDNLPYCKNILIQKLYTHTHARIH